MAGAAAGQARSATSKPEPRGVRVDSAEATRLFRAGSEAFAAGELAQAHAAFARLVVVAPHVSAAHSAFGTVLLAEMKYQAAVAELEEAHRLDPRAEQTTANLATAQTHSGQFAAAVLSFKELSVASLKGLSGSQTLAYATALANMGSLSAAEQTLQSSIVEGSATAEVFDALGSVQAQLSKNDAARESFTAAIASEPNRASAHAHLGSLFFFQGSPAEAVRELKRAAELGDTQSSTLITLGRALTASGDDQEAIAVLTKATASEPASLDAQYALALALQAAGQAAKALPLFSRVAASRRDDVAVLTNYGLALVQTGDAKTALEQYARAASKDPANATLREDMGVAYLQSNDVDHALEQFQAGLALEPASPQLHYDLGLAYKLKDDLPRAIDEMERAESLDPTLPDPPYTLGVIRMQQGKSDEAAQQFQQAVRLKPENGEAWALLGSVLKDAGRAGPAAEALRHAIALEPDQPSPHISLAAVLAAQGDRDGATAERRTAAELSRAAMSRQRAEFSLQSGRNLLAKGDIAGAVVQLNEAVAAQPNLREAHLLLADALERQGRSADALAQRQKAKQLEGRTGAEESKGLTP